MFRENTITNKGGIKTLLDEKQTNKKRETVSLSDCFIRNTKRSTSGSNEGYYIVT